MQDSLVWTEGLWGILLALLFALLVAGVLYWRNDKLSDWKYWQRFLLALLRFAAVLMIALLLAKPMLQRKSAETHKTQLLYLDDVSASIGQVIQADRQATYEQSRDAFLDELKDETQIKLQNFATQTPFDSNANLTDLSMALEYAWEHYDQRYLGAIVVATDGIYNKGQNPRYLQSSSKVPIYFVARGDTLAGIDVQVERVFSNKVVYKEDEFEVEVDVRAQALKGENVELQLIQLGSQSAVPIASKRITIDRADFFTTQSFKIKANHVGMVTYEARVRPVTQERNQQNNRYKFYVEVIENRKRIAILANGPHPDVAALRDLLAPYEQFETKVYSGDAIKQLSDRDYDLLVLHNLPSKVYALTDLLAQSEKRGVSMLYFIGQSTDLNLLSSLTNGVKISTKGGQFTEANGQFNTSFDLFTTDTEWTNMLKDVPPINVPFGSYSLSPEHEIFAYQKVKKVVTKMPLIAMGTINQQRIAFVMGTGVWRWKLYDYAQHKNMQRSSTLFEQIIQYLGVQEDKRRFRSYMDDQLFEDYEQIHIYAEYYNPSYELTTEGEVSISLVDPEGSKSTFSLSPKGNRYVLNLGSMPSGDYSYTANYKNGNETYSSKGRFTVASSSAERAQLQANFDLLRTVSAAHDGAVYLPNQLDVLKQQLIDRQLLKPRVSYLQSRIDAVDLPLLLGLILICLALEWFLRRYWGKY